jgi:tetratricopeptide (TPR) repeat protein
MKQLVLLVACLVPCASSAALAADKIKPLHGSQSSGELGAISPTEIVLKVGTTRKKLAVNEIDSVLFDGEPNELAQARIAVHAGRDRDAVSMLAKIDASKIDRPEILQDIEFYRAMAAAHLALAGTGSKADAGKKLFAFEKLHRTSFHYFEACEALGDLLAALNKFAEAESFYNKVAAAPWPEYKARAGVLVGRALLGQRQFDRASEKFDEVLAIEADDKKVEGHKLAAQLGKAAALAGSGKADEAIRLTENILAKADPENQELYARAYNVLGNCYLAAGKKKDALLAFLHVDLLYSRFADLHAESLANLATLWAEVDKTDRAGQARAMLKEKYPTSAWAQK